MTLSYVSWSGSQLASVLLRAWQTQTLLSFCDIALVHRTIDGTRDWCCNLLYWRLGSGGERRGWGWWWVGVDGGAGLVLWCDTKLVKSGRSVWILTQSFSLLVLDIIAMLSRCHYSRVRIRPLSRGPAELYKFVSPTPGCWWCDLQVLKKVVKIQEVLFVQAPLPCSQLLQRGLCVTLVCVTAPLIAFCMNTSWYKYSELSCIDPVGKATALVPGLNSSNSIHFCHEADLVKTEPKYVYYK